MAARGTNNIRLGDNSTDTDDAWDRWLMFDAMAIGFALYCVVVAAIGLAGFARTRSNADYVIGGRTLSAPVAALSAGASDMSGWLLLGLPGAVFASGAGEAWIVVGLVCGAWGSWRLVAPRLRADSERLGGAVTLPQFLARRVAARTPLPAWVATAMVLFFFGIYTAAGFVAGAKLFESTLNLDYSVALWMGVAAVLAYALFGGFLAVCWTDFFQALLMLAALATVAVLGFAHAPPAVPPEAASLGAVAVASALAWGLGYFGQPHILARFMAIDNAASVPRARRINLTWMILAGAAAVAVGLAGRGHFGAEGLADAETVFIALARDLLPSWLAGVVVAGILAAVMSTVDSLLLVASTALVEDVARPRFQRLQDRHALLLSRATVAAVALAAGLLAMDPDNAVLDLVAYAWAGLGASFGPVVLACLFWRRTSEAGVVAGIITGAAVTVAWRYLAGAHGVFDLYELLPAFVCAAGAIVVASLAPAAFKRWVPKLRPLFSRRWPLFSRRSARD